MTNQIKRTILILGIGVTLASCNSVNVPATITTSTFPAISTTPLPILSQTPTSTATALLTQTLEPTATLTPLPVLPQQTSETAIKELMKNDIDCKPPCFLGIIPGQTTLGEMKNIFIRFGLPIHDYEGKGLAYTIEQLPEGEVPPETTFYMFNNIVNSVRIYPNKSDQFEWSIFSPSAMLKRFGAPSKVTFGLSVVHEPTPTPWKAWYHMTFFYNDIDLIISYSEPEIRLGELITVCPNKDDFQGATIWLGKSPYYPPSPDDDGPLEDVTSFTLESFRDYLLLGPGACFYLKAGAIPIY